MRLHLTSSRNIAMRDPMDFRRLNVLIDAQPAEQLERSIARIGRREDDSHVRHSPSILRFLSGHAGESAWEDGISIITSGTGEAVCGIVVSSLTSTSAEPPLVGFFINQGSSCREILLRNGRFVANVIGDGHDEVMKAFVERPQGVERFAVGQWRSGFGSLPVLTDAIASMECEIVFSQAIGTHRLVVGKIQRVTRGDASPVVHYNALTHRLAQAA